MTGSDPAAPEQSHQATSERDRDDAQPWWSGLDWLLWGCALAIVSLYGAHWLLADAIAGLPWLPEIARSAFEFMNTIWWGIAAGIVMISLLGRVPREFVMQVLGTRRGLRGLWRATLAGLLLDLCSHGILMVGARLYERGASTGQVMAFLVSSPWNSLSMTLILIALVGLPWTIGFVVLSMVVALVTGACFDRLVAAGTLPGNPRRAELPEDFRFWREARRRLRDTPVTPAFLRDMFADGLMESRMVVRWILFGVLLASLVRGFVPPELFGTLFGPTLLGLAATIGVATLLEVCSEGSTPIAADIVERAAAPGNGFAFLMGGVATDYTEILVLRDATRSWKVALFLPLVALPQVLLLAWLINLLSA